MKRCGCAEILPGSDGDGNNNGLEQHAASWQQFKQINSHTQRAAEFQLEPFLMAGSSALLSQAVCKQPSFQRHLQSVL